MNDCHYYAIRDVWMALKIASKNFFGLVLAVWVIPILLVNAASNEELQQVGYDGSAVIFLLSTVTTLIFLQSVRIYLINGRYIIDLDSGCITFPRSDIENSFIDIILLKPYWNLMQAISINVTEIENIYLDTKRWTTKQKGKPTKKHVRYNLNIAGTFGSASLEFLGRQKRDEVRNAIQQAVKKHKGINIDKKVAEL